MDGGIGEDFHQGLHNLVTRQFHVEHGLAVVDLGVGGLLAFLVCLALALADVVDETACESAVQDIFLMFDESVHAFVLQLADDARPQVHHFLVLVRQSLVLDALANILLDVLPEEVEQKTFGLLVGEDFQLVGILDVHNLIADVVCRLHQIHQRVARIAERLAGLRLAQDTQFLSDFLVRIGLGVEEAEFPMVSGITTGERIFYDGGKHGIGHDEAACPSPLETVGEDAEGVGVALKMGDVVPKVRRDHAFHHLSLSLAEEGLDGFLTRVSERRIAQVVCQTGGTDDGADFLEESIL